MINKVFLLGNLGKDPEIKFTKDGTMMAIFRLATTEYIRTNGTADKITEWHTVLSFGKLAEFCAKLKKGDRVFVEGRLRTSSFQSDNKIYRVSNIVAKSIKLIPRKSISDLGIEEENISTETELEINGNELEQEEELF
ncbi:MAG: single-stranded DNA-binding protein [Candidatus Calescibacterium sp.]|nr:single-stranded DNA-binding protein [Candidatus Calescibacterium sp.]MCX7733672.1 single-stranded DNA-binding protein [bacterium]MDW8087883.1 single-stranded DNA-binding protein [Candidatus Calescibacterium sp.]